MEMGIRGEAEDQKLRFQIELEFVQCLANPNYLNFLAQRGHFRDACFVNYLKYLQYWKEPEYAKFLKYPMCLYFLDLLQYSAFRKEIVNGQCAKFIDDQQLLHWQHYARKRAKLLQQGEQRQQQQQQMQQQQQAAPQQTPQQQPPQQQPNPSIQTNSAIQSVPPPPPTLIKS